MHILLVMAADGASHIPFRDSGLDFWPVLLKALLLTAVLLGVAFGLLLLAKRLGRLPGSTTSMTDAVQVVSSRRVTAHTTVLVIRHDGDEYLLVESSRQASLVKCGGPEPTAGERPA